MGNFLKNSPVVNELRQTEMIISQAADYANRFHISQDQKTVLIRIFIQYKKQSHLLDAFMKLNISQSQVFFKLNQTPYKKPYNLNTRQELFLGQISSVELQILDSLYEHLIVKKEQSVQSDSNFDCKAIKTVESIKPYFWKQITSSQIFEIVDLQKNVSKIPDYEIYKERGFQLISQQKVCFVLLANKNNIEYSLSESIQFQKIPQLPSGSCLLQILLMKLEGLGRLSSTQISLFIFATSEKKAKIIQMLSHLRMKFVNIEFLIGLQFGVLDSKGGIVLTRDSHVCLNSMGSGDFWNSLETSSEVRHKILKFQYMEIFGTQNILEHCFDCFMLGKIDLQRIPWATISCEKNSESLKNSPSLFINQKGELQIMDISQEEYNNSSIKEIPHLFANHTVFSMKFVESALFQLKDKLMDFRVKLKFPKKVPELSEHATIITFQKQFSQIFKIQVSQFAKSGSVILMDPLHYYSPLQTHDHLKGAALVLSRISHIWLNTSLTAVSTKIIEIDPLLSLQGENLEEYSQYFETSPQIQYPLYLTIASNNSLF